uniref:E3 ubiquitin-protein ligase HUWE1-like n=1 Tax=Ciona intestinalis TaxID=7719 RepID=UPI000EF517A7|nr:E3 ubiquitin-protein ligase HUWE1-like [Ciona intestinalis]|eukprot:XP_026689880.1 E3 ubiquitin-protein ligase HUWE1-like [Ciona intestinalis]
MKIDRNKLKKCTTEVPADCRVLIDKLKTCSDEELVTILESTTAWTVGKCELYHWVDVLDRFDGILSAAAYTGESEWLLTVNTDEHLQELALAVLHFTSLLIEYSFSRHLYNSVEHLISLLSSSNLDMILSVLNLLYVFSKRSNFLSRLADKQRLPLLKRLGYLAENWGGKENGFGLAESCLDSPVSTFPSNATTLHYEFYADTKTVTESQHTAKKQANNMYCIHVENVHQMSSSPAEIMESLIKMYPVPNDSKMLLYTHLRLAHSFSQHKTRLKCVQARLHAISVLVYTNSVSENIGSILYSGFTEELVDLLQVKDNTLVDIKAAALRTLTSIVHLDCRDRTPRLGAIVDVTGVSQYHGFLPVLVRRCIDSMTSTKKTKEENPEFPHSFATALFSFLYHLSSYESGGEALVQSGMMGPLLSVVTNMGDQQEQTTFVTRAVRVIDLITNIDWQAFQAINGLQVFIDRLEHEVAICKKDAPMACDTIPGAAESPSDDVMEIDGVKEEPSTSTEMETEESDKPKEDFKPGAQCLPQRAALFKSVLNFLKKAISDQAFGGQVRHMMDGTLPNSLKHIIGNVEYYGPALFLLAMEVVTVYVFQEPSLLSSLQDNRLTHVMLHALLVKDPPATREVLASLPNIFSALCINTRGLEAFVNCNPFDRLFHVMLSPDYLLAMRRRRSSDPLGDTASNLGHAMDELMRQQPSLRGATIKAILQLLCELKCLGNDPNIICSRATSSKNEGGGSNAEGTNASSNAPGENGSQADESTAQDDAGSEDEVEEVEEVASTSKQSSSSVQMLTAAGGAKKNVPLLDYIQNVTKFIQAIVSNNTGDHCTKFNETGGIAILLHLLRLPSLPLDFPTSAACQSITNLTQTVFILLRAPTVVGESLAHVLDILKNELQPLFLTTPGETRTRPASVLLHELTQQQSADAAENEGSSLVKSLVHLHAFVTLFLTLPRANQNEIRTIIVNQWGSRMGITALEGLNKLYRSLIWESTVLLALCTPGAIPEDSEFGEKELENLLSSAEQGTSKTDSTEASVGMEMEGNEIKSAGSKHKMSPAFSARIKCIKPVLTVASKLGRSLAELFGLLVKLAVGKPIRQRYGRHMAVAHAQNVAPSRPARKLAYSLSTLLLDGLSWRAPPNVPSSKLRTTFLICTVGFTIPMLFDEKKMPYHLMLQYFAGTGSLDALFNCFKWALSSQLDEDNSAEVSSQSNELPGSVDDFLEAWLMLLERLVNPRNILNSPYVIHDKPAATTPTDELAPIVAPFSAVKFLIKTQKAALEALQHLWCSRRLSKLSSRICDSVILILCHLIRGEQIARDKLNEEREEREKKAKANPPTAQEGSAAEYYYDAPLANRSTSTSVFSSSPRTNQATGTSSRASAIPTTRSTRPPNLSVVHQLVDMGFAREQVLQALMHASTLEAATEWLLTHSSEDDQLLRAISMSLEGTPAAAASEEPETDAEEEVRDQEGAQLEEDLRAAARSSVAEPEKNESSEPDPSQEEDKKKKEEEEQMKVEDEKEMKMLSQDDEEPMSASDIDDFAASIFERGLELVNHLPDTVYRVCDVIVVLMKRAGKNWSDGVFNKLVVQIKEKCQKLTDDYKSNGDGVWLQDDEFSDGLAAQALLFALLYEEMKEPCTRVVSHNDLIPTFVALLSCASTWLQDHNDVSTTPKWISPVLLLVDLYERTCITLARKSELQRRFEGHRREWKWFDDRSGRWCSYSASNHKSIDDAYAANLPGIRFTAGRRRYTINFLQLIQFNEESGNRRPIMATYVKDSSLTDKDSNKKSKSEEETMETDNNGKAAEPVPTSSEESFSGFIRLSPVDADKLVHSCTAFVCLPVDADTLHSSMRLLLRLTRNGIEGGHLRALMFAELGGPAALLRLKFKHGFVGFASLATLLLRHILEEDATLKYSMDKVGVTKQSSQIIAKHFSEETMETDNNGKAAEPVPTSSEESFSGFIRLSPVDADKLVHSCTAFVCLPVDADTLHSSMRLLLRLTRNGIEGGHLRALMFAELGGPAALLRLKFKHGFVGFASLATLLLRHILEEDATLKYSMDKAIHDITVSGAGNASCGVTSGSVGARELHYVLRALAPAACQHPDLFSEACKKNMKIVLPSLTSRNVETEEDNLVSSTGVQIISQSKRTQQAQPSLHLPPVVVETLKLLLDALVATDDFGSEAGADQRNSSTSVKLDASTSTSKDNEELNLHQILQSEHSFGEKTQVKSEEGAKKSDHDPKASMEGKPLVTKSAILRLLAELVKSYPSCAYLLANHQYKANMTPIVTQDCSCLSFILDNLLTPRTEEAVAPTPPIGATTSQAVPPTNTAAEATGSQGESKPSNWDKDCPALSRVLLACLAACQLQHPSGTSTLPGHDPHVALVSELKSAISRTVHTPESPQKHKRLRALLEIVTTIIECTRTNPQQPRRTLARNQLPEPNVDQSQSVVPRLMVRRGLTTDLAKITHYIDLGSSEMADTVNAALRPLEILTRYTSLYSNKAQQSENKKTTTEEETSQARSEQVQDRQASAEITSNSLQEWLNSGNNDGECHLSTVATLLAADDDNMSDEYMDVLNPDNVSQESDLQYLDASEMQPGHRQDVFMREDEEEIAASRIEQDHDENDGDTVAVDEDERVEDDIADDTINGDESTDSEQDEDDDDDDDDQDDEIEDDGSEMDNQEMDEDEVIEEFGEDVDYETFVYDFMHGDHQDMDLFIQMEDIFGSMPGGRLPNQLIPMHDGPGRRLTLPLVVHDDNRDNNNTTRSIPPPPGMIALCHPLLVRHANHAQITDSGGPISIPRQGFSQSFASVASGTRNVADGWTHQVSRAGNLSTAQQQQLINQQESNHTIHLHYTGGRQPRNAPLVLQRLLGPTVAQDILQVSNSLYTEGGGRAQLIVNTDDANYTPTDIIDVIFLDSMFQQQSGVMANHSASLVPDNVPSSLARWVEESCVLDSQSLYDCITVIKDEIVKHVLDVRDEELSERKEKRKKEKEEKQKEEEQKKKEREEKEKAKKQKKEEVVENTPAEQVTTSSSPSIATPSNTPVATRPDSPSVSSTTERAPAINALQQASSSLLAVSGQLEGLSFSLQQAIGASEDVPATARSASDAQGETVSMVAEAAPFSADGATEQLAVPASDRGMDNASPQSDVTMETYEAVAQSAANEMVVSEAEVVTTTTEEGATASSATAPSQVMEGVDPSFLAALPADIRQEVIREQLSRSSHRTVAASSTTGQPSHSGVSPEFLAALPPNIQEEVLEQERRERSRNTAQQAAAGENLDPTTFIQTLPPELRQSVLSDMDESLVAVLSEELAAEAQSLRDDVDERQRRYLQERLLTHGVGLLRQGGVRSRSRHITEGFGGFQRRPGYTESTTRTGQTSTTTTPPLVCRQILDHESLACLLLLLFVDETKLNTNWLHRVLRNLCYHVPSRDWLVATLMSILHRASELHSPKPTTDSEMDVTPSQPTKLQKQMPKKSSISSSADTSFRNTSWMSIKLEAALGSRSSIFQVEGGSSISPSPGSMKKHGRDQGSESSTKRVHIHPQASPVVCRHAIDALIVLSKIFPNYFITQQPSKPKTVPDKSSMIETDFWDILLRLDASSAHKKKVAARHQHFNEDDPHVAGDSASEKSNIDLSITWLGVLMRMLSQPVVKRSQQLTDKMLRLLAQISRYITSEQSQKAKKDTPASGTAPNASVSNTGATTSAEVQVTSADQNVVVTDQSETSGTSTATMGARAGTSNTSTVGRSTAAPQTSTTSSSRSQGSISTISETPATSGAKEDTALQLEKELSLTVGVLTTHACSEEGLEDATTLLLHLSKSAPALRLLIIRLSLEGAQKLGGLLASQIKELLDEIIVYNQQQLASGAIPAVTTAPTKGVIVNRFDSTLTVVLSAKDKFKKLGRELQLPSMQALTSKTSHQAFFLRILKVIIQLQQASKGGVVLGLNSNQSRFGNNQFRRWRTGGSMLSAVQNTVSRLEREADALMDIISPPLPRYRNQTARASQSSSSAAASSSKSETEEEEKKDESTLSERLQLDELWEILGACLKELSKSHDQHAVLVLQPAVEAFFLVHSSETSQSSARRGGGGAETETRESQLAHINEQPPVSPGQPTGSTSESSSSLSSQSSLIDASMPIDTQKFLKFADTHRTVLNQILRQSTVPLSDGPFSVLVDHTRVLDFDVKRRYFRQELERTENSPIRRDDVAIRVQRDHLFEDSFRELHRRTPAELRSRLYVVFDGEDGQDAGGVLREWYLVISREIFNPMYALFRTSPGDHGTYTINPLSYINPNHLSYFKFVGRIVAKAIYDNKLLECYFTRSFYKHILGKPVKYTDMEADDYEFSQGLRYLLEHDITSLGTELFFSVEIEEFGKTEVRDLKENGRNLPVSEKNKREYAHLVCQEKMTGAIKKQLAAFLEGFYEIIPKRLISIFDEQELELLISGLPNVDIDDLRQNTEYHKYQPNSPQIQWFWRALRSFDQAERAKFLQFVTGTSKVPLQGFSTLEGMTGVQKFQIHRDDRSTARLPCAHTCFNQLDLPAYENYDKLRERLLLAITECTEGFGLA